MRVKILVLGLVSLCLLFTVGIQAQEKYTLTELEGVMDSAVFKATGRRIITMLEKENGVVNFYVDTHVKDFTSSASYTDYQTINAVVVSAAITMKQVSWKADRVWFLRAGEKLAWISVDRCKTILDRKSKSPSYLFDGINLVDTDLIAQEKPKIEKNLKATTEDGRKVRLKTDGTWEFIKEEAKVYKSVSATVYITKTGKKYHRSSCSYLIRSKTSISLKDACARGYTPCSRCNPPRCK